MIRSGIFKTQPMPALASPSSSTQPHDLLIYQNFVGGAAKDDDVVLNVDKATATVSGQAVTSGFQKLYRWLFGQNKSAIVEDFSAALEAKYGKDVASFAFSDDQKQQALHAGLSKSMIKRVIKNASIARSAKDDIQAYVQKAKWNIEIAQRANPEINIADLLEKVKDFANRQLHDFKNIDALKATLQEAITVATASKTFTEIEDGATVWRGVPDAPMTEEALQAALNATRLQHKNVMSELEARFRTNPKALEAQLENFSRIAVHATQQTAPQLAVFAHYVNADPSACFHLDIHGSVVARPASTAGAAPQLTVEENQKVWDLLCRTLETCYGKPLLQRMIPEEKRQELFSSSLTTGHVKQLFNDIQCALEADLEFLKSQPFIVDDKYCNALSTNPQLSQEALEAEQRLATHGTYSIQLARKLFDIGVLSAGYHTGGLVAGGVGTTVATMTGITLPIIPLTLVASAFCSFVAGRIVGSRISNDVGAFTANRAAAYTIGSTSTEIASKPLIDSFRDYLTHCLADTFVGPGGAHAITFLTQFFLEEEGSIVADCLRNACIGSVVNGIDIENLPALPNLIRPAQAADIDFRIVDLVQTMFTTADQLSPPPS